MFGAATLIAFLGTSLWLAVASMRAIGDRRRSLAALVALAWCMVAPAIGCRLGLDLLAAMLGSAVLAAFVAVMLLRLRPPDTLIETEPGRLHPVALVFAGLSLVAVIWCQLSNHFWDENQMHIGVSNNVARGRVPPEHPMFPNDPLRYHYGFNVLVAVLRAALHLRIELAIDVVAIGLFALILWLASDVGRRLGGAWGASLAVVLIPMGSSFAQAWVYPNIMGPLELRASFIPTAWLNMWKFPPPVIHNFFQKPQALGMVFALGGLLLFDLARDRDRTAGNDERRRVLAALVLAASALGQFPFFCVMGVALGAGAMVRAARLASFWDAAKDLTVLAVALVLAVVIGGFIDTQGTLSQQIRWGQRFFDEPLGPAVLHHLLSFGLPMLAVPFTLVQGIRRRDPLLTSVAVGAVVGFVVPNLMVYARSWDVVKFFNVACFLANVALVQQLVGLLVTRSTTLVRAVAALIVAASIFTGWYFLARVSFLDGRYGVTPMKAWISGPPPMTHTLSEALGPLIPRDDRVFSTNIEVPQAGFLSPGFDWRVFAPGLLIDRAAATRLYRAHSRARHGLSARDLEILGVKWAVFSPGDIAALSPSGRARLADPSLFERIQIVEGPGGTREVFRYLRHREPE